MLTSFGVQGRVGGGGGDGRGVKVEVELGGGEVREGGWMRWKVGVVKLSGTEVEVQRVEE